MKKIIVGLVIILFLAICINVKTSTKYNSAEKSELDREQNCEEGTESLLNTEDVTEGEIINNEEKTEDRYLQIRQLRMLIENNKFEEFLFQSGEKAICIYEGTINFASANDMFAIYKETIGKDIIFINIFFIEKETGNIYTWKGEDLVKIGVYEKSEPEQADVSELDSSLLYENISTDELLNNVMKVLEQNGYNQLNLIYDGTVEFVNRKYYMVSSFDNYEEHILREQEYYIDMNKGYIYSVEENADYLRTELYFVGEL